jgi:hypothetical protein
MKNPLTDVLPAHVRKVLYAVAFVLALLFGLWQASKGDWAEFIGSVLAALVPLLAASNTPAPPTQDETTTTYVPEHRA